MNSTPPLLFRWNSLSPSRGPLELTLTARERILVTGPSGSGKSRWLKRLIGLDPEFKDQIELNRQSVPMLELRKKVLWIPQTPIRESVPVSTWIRERREFIAVDSSFEERIHELFPQQSDFLSRPMTLLSGGELQAVILCFALAIRPQVLLLDESTSAMDTHLKNRIESALFNMDPTAIVWIRHDSPNFEHPFDRQITFTSS